MTGVTHTRDGMVTNMTIHNVPRRDTYRPEVVNILQEAGEEVEEDR
jgi:hypothetical protein